MKWFDLFYLNASHLKLALRLDHYQYHFLNSGILAIGGIIPIICGLYLHELSYSVSAFIGALLVGVYNPDEPHPILIKTLVGTLIGVSAGAIIGLLVSGSYLWIIFSSIGVAAICGYIGVLGPHAAVIGILTLVSFCVFAGKQPMTNMEQVWHMLSLIAGGVLQLVIALLASNPKTFKPLRRKLSNCFCMLGSAAQAKPLNLLLPTFITPLFQVNNDIPFSGAAGKTAKWLHELADDCDLVRLNLIELSYQIEVEIDPNKKLLLEDYCCFVGQKLIALGKTISDPKYLASVEQINKTPSLNNKNESLQAYAEYLEIERVLQRIYTQLNRPFPVGKHCQIAKPLSQDIHPFEVMKEKLTIDNIFFRHALKLAIIIPIAWVLGFFLLGDNQFWVPLTIAWITKPDYVGTVPRILARVLGTILGVALVVLILAALHPSQWTIVALCFLAIFTIYTYLFVNYAIAVSFITVVVLFLLEIIQPQNEYAVIEERVFATLLGGILALIATNIKPIFISGKIIPSFLHLLNTCKNYVALAVSDPKNILDHTRAVKAARIETMAIIENAKSEPDQIKILSNETAEKVLLSILEGMFTVMSIQTKALMTGSQSEIEAHFQDIEDALDLLINRFNGLAKGIVVEDNGAMEQLEIKSNNRAIASIRRAYSYLEIRTG